MKISTKAKDCSLTVKIKTTGREKIDEKDLDRFARAYLRCFLKPKQYKSNAAEYTGPIGIPLKERLKKEITKRDFLFIVEYVVVAVQKLSGNKFSLCNLNLDLEHVYINETTKELQFLYVPLVGRQESADVIELLNSVIYLARPAAERDTDYISRFNYFVKSINPFDINMVEQFVQHEDRSVVNTVRKHNAGQSGFMTSDHKHYYNHMDAQKSIQQEEAACPFERLSAPTRPAGDEDATSLLESEQASANCYSGYGETAGPANGFVQAVDSSFDHGRSAESFAGSEDATGLLTNYAETAGYGMVSQEVADYYSGYGETESPGTGFVQNNNHFAGAEDATGLLTEDPGISGYSENTEHDKGFEDDATSLLVEADDTATPERYQTVPAVVYPELYRTQTGETVQINKPVFRIGKERSYVDYFVTNNNAVSRSHADIISRDTGYFIIDLNSKNRTYINNRAIAPQTETAIKDGDLLRLGNEEFIFRAAGSAEPANGSRCCTNCNTPIKPGANFCIKCGQRV